MGCTGHSLVAHDGQFAGLGQVGKEVDERIELLNIARLVQRQLPLFFAFFQHLAGADAGCGTISHRPIIVVEGAILAGSKTDDVQQIVVEDSAVYSFRQ